MDPQRRACPSHECLFPSAGVLSRAFGSHGRSNHVGLHSCGSKLKPEREYAERPVEQLAITYTHPNTTLMKIGVSVRFSSWTRTLKVFCPFDAQHRFGTLCPADGPEGSRRTDLFCLRGRGADYGIALQASELNHAWFPDNFSEDEERQISPGVKKGSSDQSNVVT